MSAALSQPTLAAPSSPSFCEGRKFSEVEQAVLWTLLQQDPQCTSRDLLAKAAEHQIWPQGEPETSQPLASPVATESR